MCGLVAVINKNRHGFNNKQLDVFETLLFIDTLRGEDSTGVFLVQNNGNVHIAKEATEATHFLRADGYRKDIRGKAYSRGQFIVGHNRKATRGSITDENAHPFWVEDKLVLVHNGSLHGDHKKLADTEVDSHAVAHVLANEPDHEKALQQINGAYALIWYDVVEKKLHMIRNTQRPLYWAETSDAIYICSEAGMLYFALARNGEKIKENKEKLAACHLFPVHNLNSWSLEGRSENRDLDCGYRFQGTTTEAFDNEAWTNAMAHAAASTAANDAASSSCALTVVKNEKKESEPEIPSDIRPVSYKQWVDVKDRRYPKGRMVKVLVDNYHWDIEKNQSTIFLTGRTADELRSFVMFPAEVKDVQKFSKTDSNEPALFNVVIDQCGWRPMMGPSKVPYEDTEGYVRIIGSHSFNLSEEAQNAH